MLLSSDARRHYLHRLNCSVVVAPSLDDPYRRYMPGKEGPFFKKEAADQGNYLESYGKEPCIEVGSVREFQVRCPHCSTAACRP